MRSIVIRAVTENTPVKDLILEDPGRVYFGNDVIESWIETIETRAPNDKPD